MKNIPRETSHAREEGKEEKEGDEEEEEEAQCEWDFNLTTVVSSNMHREVSDTLGVIEFDPSDQLLVTGGIARKIRIYTVKSLVPQEPSLGAHPLVLDHTTACDFYICTPAKLSSLRWRPDSASHVVGSGDYDGVVTEYDLDRRMAVFERDEHGGRRVWSLDYSRWAAPVGASGSDDGTAHLWDPRCGAGGTCVAVVRPSVACSPVCCVEFDPCGGPLIAIGSADRRAYTYDVRNMSGPVSIFSGHEKTVTYVRFLGECQMVTAATDGCLKLWDMIGARVIRTYKGHVNSRSFVGLSVWRNAALFGCGSESNEVYVYDRRWAGPIWVRGFGPASRDGCDDRFVSSVCWRQAGDDECTLVAGGSDGNLQVFVGQKKPSFI
ncbi:WD repeat-containing protein RUP2-like [Magnolia sinica]|uniref:WD repeat-containing protein RUP2-like n=1 Tax=Magnolia sinica TaxID=86752 RepID=UPI00265B50D5|nr:WD repeat-containing protein RUP2-like [Magnolia sinica]